jgi:hypothetical protein
MALTQERLKELLHYDPETGIFTWMVDRRGGAWAGDIAGRLTSRGYWEIRIDFKFCSAARIAWLYVHGELSESVEVDHINRVRHDNRISNLRLATLAQNKQNISPKRNSRSGLLCVCWNSSEKKWLARICISGKRKYLGLFETAEEAHEAYLKAKRELHEFCTI